MRTIITAIVVIILFGLLACTSHVFHNPIAISTKSEPIKNFQPIKTVKATSCNYLFLMLLPINPPQHKIFDDLLAEAKKAGGTAVIDMQLNTTDDCFIWFFRLFIVCAMRPLGPLRDSIKVLRIGRQAVLSPLARGQK